MPTGVVVTQRFSTAETFKQRVGSEYHVLDLLNSTVLPSRHSSNILHDPFGSLCLSCSRFARDDYTLVLVIGVHVVICAFCDTEDVWGHFQSILAAIPFQHFFCVNPEIYREISMAQVEGTHSYREMGSLRLAPSRYMCRSLHLSTASVDSR